MSWEEDSHHWRKTVIMGGRQLSWEEDSHHGRKTVVMGGRQSSWEEDSRHGRKTVVMGGRQSSWENDSRHGRKTVPMVTIVGVTHNCHGRKIITIAVLPSRESDQEMSKSEFYQTIFLPKIIPKADPNSLF